MPVGTYSGWLSVDVEGANGPRSLGMALLSFVDVDLSQDRTVMMDARKAVQVQAEVPQEADPAAMRLDVIRQFPNGGYTASSDAARGRSYDSLWALPTGKKVTDGVFEFGAQFRLEQPALTVAAGGRASATCWSSGRHAAAGGYPSPLDVGRRRRTRRRRGSASGLTGHRAVVVRAQRHACEIAALGAGRGRRRGAACCSWCNDGVGPAGAVGRGPVDPGRARAR